jgi:phenol 2-monooxygenase
MKELGVTVERSTRPTSIELSEDENELMDPTSHPVRVVLERLDLPEGESKEEIVHAKFVLGADGALQRCHPSQNITFVNRRSFMGPQRIRYIDGWRTVW